MRWIRTHDLPEELALLFAHLDSEAVPREARALLPVDVDLAATRRRHDLLRALAFAGWPLGGLGLGAIAATWLPPGAPWLPPSGFGVGLLLALLGAFMVFQFGLLRGTERRRLDFPHAGTLAVSERYMVLIGFEEHQVFDLAELRNLHLLIRTANSQFAYGELHFDDADKRVELPLMSLVGEEQVRKFAEAVSEGSGGAQPGAAEAGEAGSEV